MIDVGPHRLLYLAKSGSQLFGTATPHSDLDVKGLFLPSKQSLYLQVAPGQFSANSNPSDSQRKNTSDDVDITVWSLQFWLKLLERGDINAVSLLFSHTHPEALLPGTDLAFAEQFRALDARRLLHRSLGGMMGFAHSQAIKYSDKGKHLRAVRVALEHLGKSRGLVADVAPDIVAALSDERLARVERSAKGLSQLIILEKAFDSSAKADWAARSLAQLEARYGKRAAVALESGGLDFKAFSHSLRVLEEMRLLHLNARIVYPHAPEFAALLRDIRRGLYDAPSMMRLLDEKLEQTQAAEAKSLLPETIDPEYASSFVLSLYAD